MSLPRVGYVEGIGHRVHGEWSKEAAPVPELSVAWNNALCSICHLPMKGGEMVQDCFYFEPDGTLDCIELAHEGCVPKEEKS